MAGETIITLVGNLTGDPELRFTPSGSAVANFTVASTPRTLDRQSNEWKDGETLFMRCSIWREAAENVAESLTKGTRVVVTGRMKSRSYQTKEGENRTVIELEADEVGPVAALRDRQGQPDAARWRRRWRFQRWRRRRGCGLRRRPAGAGRAGRWLDRSRRPRPPRAARAAATPTPGRPGRLPGLLRRRRRAALLRSSTSSFQLVTPVRPTSWSHGT